jgi:hypothetical protein
MKLALFLVISFPAFVLWMLYRFFIKKENYVQLKDALYTGLFSFTFMALILYFLVL